jgi:hypothetical protein
VENRDGEKDIFHDPGFLELNFIAQAMFHHLRVEWMTFMRLVHEPVTRCTAVIAAGSCA